MRGKDLLEGLGFVDDRFVEKADSVKPRKVRTSWTRWVSLAACLCLLAVGAAVVWNMLPAASRSSDIAGAFEQLENADNGMAEIAEDNLYGEVAGSTAWLYGCQYIRTDGGMEGAEYPYACVIRSRAELEAYYEDNQACFDLERNEGFWDACDRYDEAFFLERDLILVVLEEGSGSIRHEVESAQPCDGGWLLTIRRIVPEMGTDDMAQWHILVEIPKDLIGEQEEIILELYNGMED